MNTSIARNRLRDPIHRSGVIASTLFALLLVVSGAANAAEPAVSGYAQVKQKYQSLRLARPDHHAVALVPSGSLRIIVKARRAASEPFTSTTGSASLARVERSAVRQGGKLRRKIPRHNLLALQLTEAQFDALVASGDVQAVREDIAAKPQLSLSVPFIRANLVHNAGHRGGGTAVAILDTGIQADHPFFEGRVAEEACFSSGGDGVNGFNLCPNGQTTQIGMGAAQGCELYPDSGACYHGTHVAGIAAGDNGSLRGVAPDAKIIAVQVFTYYPNAGLYTWSSDLAAAYDWLLNGSTTANLAAVNMSLSGGASTTYCDEGDVLAPLIQALRVRGAASVVATGNSGLRDAIGWPSCISSAVAVGAVERSTDVIADYANIGPILDLLAPGSEILSSVYGSSYASYWGTSMAAPHVAGAFAALKSASASATVDRLEQAMKASAVSVRDTVSGASYPRIDVYGAYQRLSSDPSCTRIPGTVTMNAGNFNNGETKSWQVFAQRGGLFRVWQTSTASSSSHALRLRLRDQSVNVSIGAGQTTLADFANVTAGEMTLAVTSTSQGLSLGTIRVEQLATNDSTATGECQQPIAIPGVIAPGPVTIAQGQTVSWPLQLNASSNVRIVFIGATSQSSGSVALNFNGIDVPLSFNPGQQVIADFANIPNGIRTLSIRATANGVFVSNLEARLY